MRRPGYFKLVEKSRAACIAAVETYNRASCQYREESFSILMINAWELLLKARIIQANGGRTASIYEYRQKKKKDGSPSKIREPKITRSGAQMTIGLEKAYNIVSGYTVNGIDAPCIHNIEALLEIRDSATHFVTNNASLKTALAEISLAAVKNYVIAVQKWFGLGFDDLNIASLPLSFDLDQMEVEAIAKKSPDAVTRFLKHVREIAKDDQGTPSDFSFAIKVKLDIVKSKVDGAVPVTLGGDNPALTIAIEDDKVPSGFDWDYKTLTGRLEKRYSDFKQNSTYHSIRQPLEKKRKLCFERYLDPEKKSSSKKRFYNPNIIKEFDKHYTKRGATLFEKEED